MEAIENHMLSAASLPWTFLLLPKLKLRFSISRPPAWAVMIFLFATYFLVMSGIVYDLIVEPPSIGSQRDDKGNIRPMVFLMYRVNGQFIIEGLAAGAMFLMGGFGWVMLDKVIGIYMYDDLQANKPNVEKLNRVLLLGSGCICVIVSYTLLIVFLRMKVPGYLRNSQ